MISTRKKLLLLPIGIALLLIAYFGPSAYRKAEMDKEVDRLCAVDGGVKVYERIALPKESFDNRGNPKIPFKGGRASDKSQYVVEDRSTKVENRGGVGTKSLTLHRFHYQVIRVDDNKVLGEAISYSRAGGDPEGPWQPSSYRGVCTEQADSFQHAIFVRQN